MSLSLGNALLGTTGLSTGLGLSVGNGLTFSGFAFSPASLFTGGVQGVWYDPSDFSTLFQDSAGTTPVTAVEQPVGLMLDKSRGLTLGSELVTNGTFASGTTGWTAIQSTLTNDAGRLRVSPTVSGGYAYQGISTVVGRWYRITFSVTNVDASGRYLFVGVGINANAENYDSGALADGTYTAYFVATATTTYVKPYVIGSGTSALYDNISVNELPGNHATQSTSAARPVLSARVNVFERTEAFDNVYWSKLNCTVSANATTAPDGTNTADNVITANGTFSANVVGLAVNLSWTSSEARVLSFSAKTNGLRFAQCGVTNGAGLTATIGFDLQTGAVSTSGANYCTFSGATITLQSNGFYRCSVVITPTSADLKVPYIVGSSAMGGVSNRDATGDGTSGIYIWGADLRVANDGVGLPVYQRVNTSTDYDTTGFPFYLRLDGTDDGMATGSINFASTDKMTVFGGVRKITDAANIICEFSANVGTNAGSFYFVSGQDGALPVGYTFLSRGSASATPALVAYLSPAVTAPNTSVLAATGDIPGDLNTIRGNTVLGVNGTGDQGTGTYGNYPLYIGSRAGTLVRFNGRIYSLIVRGAASTAQQISDTETWVNGKTKAY